MLALSMAALAEEPSLPEQGTELLDFPGISKDNRFVILEVRDDIHTIAQSVGETRLRIAIDTQSGERKRWLVSSTPNKDARKDEDPELWQRWEAQLSLPGLKDYEAWAKTVGIGPLELKEQCGVARRYAEILVTDPDTGAPSGSWKGAHYNVSGMGQLVYGVERDGYRWEHGARDRGDRGFVWIGITGGLELTAAWSQDCSRIVWVVRDTTPEMIRDGYSADYKDGTIVEVQILPAGPTVAVAGAPDRSARTIEMLAKAGFWAVPTDLSLPAGNATTIYTWSAAEPIAKALAAKLSGAVVAPLPQPTSIDIVVVPK